MLRSVGLMLFMKTMNVSVRYTADDEEPAIEAAIKRHLLEWRLELEVLTGYIDTINRGQAISRKTAAMVTGDRLPDPEQEQTLSDIRAKKQSVLSPLAAVPGAKTVSKDKGKKDKPNTRSSEADASTQAAQREKTAVDKAVARAKRQREDDIAAAAAKTPAPKRARRGAGGASQAESSTQAADEPGDDETPE